LVPVVIIENRAYNLYNPKSTERTLVIRYEREAVEEIIRTDPANPLALFAAAGRGDAALTKQLLDRGADPNRGTNFGHYAIHEAANGHKDVLDILLAAGADVNVRVSPDGPASPNQWTPLHYAAYGGYTEIAAALISRGADVNAKDLWGRTPLQCARMQNKSDVVALLLEHGATDRHF
jgi:ankyrin repeat protein